jgi:hypothetical protein
MKDHSVRVVYFSSRRANLRWKSSRAVAIRPVRADIWEWQVLRRRRWLLRKAVLLKGNLEMPNDAKFGLIIGVTVVIAISVVFFRKEPGRLPPRAGQTAAAVGASSNVPAHSMSRAVEAETAAQRTDQARSR